MAFVCFLFPYFEESTVLTSFRWSYVKFKNDELKVFIICFRKTIYIYKIFFPHQIITIIIHKPEKKTFQNCATQ